MCLGPLFKIETIENEIKGLTVNLEKSYPLEEAIEIVRIIRSQNNFAELYPDVYARPTIGEDEAMGVALKEYQKYTSSNPDNYGELTVGAHKPIYYSFYCRDFQKEEDGMSPGRLSFRVDKLSGKLLTSAEVKAYSKLNYSF